jgi:cytosine/adenosine deaminase-related metal-dependent hydrolase
MKLGVLIDIARVVQKYFYGELIIGCFPIRRQENINIVFIYSPSMKYVTGKILRPDGLKEGYLGFDKNVISDYGHGAPPEKPVADGLVIPFIVNAHTHIGDAFIKKKHVDLPHDVEQLVAPPDGLKHRLLKTASEKEIFAGMNDAIDAMWASGTCGFCDFREGGIEGVFQLKRALRGEPIYSVVLSRPVNLWYDRDEVELLLRNSDGIGLSSLSDWDYPEIVKVARHCHRREKLFALHCSEVVREDIDLVLDLKPDFLVHLVMATESDLIRIKECNIPVVVCPRSNVFFGLKPNFALMRQVGVELMLGTDNAMITKPDLLEEIRYVNNRFGFFSVEELLMMITYTPRKALNLDHDILGPNSPSNFIVLDSDSLEPVYRVQSSK